MTRDDYYWCWYGWYNRIESASWRIFLLSFFIVNFLCHRVQWAIKQCDNQSNYKHKNACFILFLLLLILCTIPYLNALIEHYVRCMLYIPWSVADTAKWGNRQSKTNDKIPLNIERQRFLWILVCLCLSLSLSFYRLLAALYLEIWIKPAFDWSWKVFHLYCGIPFSCGHQFYSL